MEIGGYANKSLYATTKPPALEEAGLEDTALSPDLIQEAFHKAAGKVKSVAAGALGIPILDEKEERKTPPDHAEGPGCVNPGSIEREQEDAVVDYGSLGGQGSGEGCGEQQTGGMVEEGKDLVVEGGGKGPADAVMKGSETGPRLGDQGCVDASGLTGLATF